MLPLSRLRVHGLGEGAQRRAGIMGECLDAFNSAVTREELYKGDVFSGVQTGMDRRSGCRKRPRSRSPRIRESTGRGQWRRLRTGSLSSHPCKSGIQCQICKDDTKQQILLRRLDQFPAVALLGPRQAGKSA